MPEGLTPAQYEAFLNAEEEKKEATKKRFPRGKSTQSLTEWMLEGENKGLKGQDLNRKGHKYVKAKYDSFYSDENPIDI